jgi:hypothetical protein
MIIRRFLPAALAVLLAGCGGRTIQQPEAGPQKLVRVDWFGHQCFRIRSTLGVSILTNPFAPGTVDFSQPKNLQPEIVLVTNEESDTNYIDMVDSTPHILRGSVGVGTNTARGIRIVGVPIYRDPDNPSITEGMTVAYRWTVDGLKFAFLGKLDRPLTDAEAAKIGRVDVLFLPAGGTDLTTAGRTQILEQLRPQVIVPMGTATAVNRMASGFTSVYRLREPAALLSRQALPPQPTVLVFRAP